MDFHLPPLYLRVNAAASPIMYMSPTVHAASSPHPITSSAMNVGRISRIRDRIMIVNIVNLVSPAPFSADEFTIPNESIIDYAATNFIAVIA